MRQDKYFRDSVSSATRPGTPGPVFPSHNDGGGRGPQGYERR